MNACNKYMNKAIDEIMEHYRNALGFDLYRIPSLMMISDARFYKKTGINYQSIVNEKHCDYMMAINQSRKLQEYVACCKYVAATTHNGRFKIPKDVNRARMEQDLNGIWKDIDFRITQSIGELQFKYMTLQRVINGKFFKATGFSSQVDINSNRKDFMTEIYVNGLLDTYREIAEEVLSKYDN